MKIVVDTNILMDAWSDNFSYARKIVDAVIRGDIAAVASHKIWREYQLILDRLVNDEEHYNLANSFFAAVEMVEVRRRVNVVKYDRDDNKFFACAEEAGAEYIVSNDMHLIEVGEYKGIRAMKPKDFWLGYEAGGKDDGADWKNWMKGILGK
ncbi:putative toxin-antitoxin system toxin component, PIN family [Candidatus Kuenenbacteria bacterium]|nr:putative toxin-antitoxin system toxin component, PIN family [Candidatus Kuenenbacteria bacterium]